MEQHGSVNDVSTKISTKILGVFKAVCVFKVFLYKTSFYRVGISSKHFLSEILQWKKSF